jgi:transcriptional regulator with XRE-family HTH domain
VAAYNECVHLGQRLRTKRRELGLRTEDVADQLGVKQATVSRWENGRCPDRSQWAGVAAFLEVDETELGRLIVGVEADDQAATIKRLETRLAELEERLARVEQPPDTPPGVPSTSPRKR